MLHRFCRTESAEYKVFDSLAANRIFLRGFAAPTYRVSSLRSTSVSFALRNTVRSPNFATSAKKLGNCMREITHGMSFPLLALIKIRAKE